MTVRSQIAEMLDVVPDSDLPVILEVVRRFVSTDDVETEADKIAHTQAMREYENGETVSHSDIDWG